MLLGRPVSSDIDAMKCAARELAALGCAYVLVKGGHVILVMRIDVQREDTEATDVLYCAADKQFHLFSQPFIYSWNAHGTGCTLSSAIASYLAKGKTVEEAVALGKEYVYGALKSSRFLRIGKGRQGAMNHMYLNYQYE